MGLQVILEFVSNAMVSLEILLGIEFLYYYRGNCGQAPRYQIGSDGERIRMGK